MIIIEDEEIKMNEMEQDANDIQKKAFTVKLLKIFSIF